MQRFEKQRRLPIVVTVWIGVHMFVAPEFLIQFVYIGRLHIRTQEVIQKNKY